MKSIARPTMLTLRLYIAIALLYILGCKFYHESTLIYTTHYDDAHVCFILNDKPRRTLPDASYLTWINTSITMQTTNSESKTRLKQHLKRWQDCNADFTLDDIDDPILGKRRIIDKTIHMYHNGSIITTPWINVVCMHAHIDNRHYCKFADYVNVDTIALDRYVMVHFTQMIQYYLMGNQKTIEETTIAFLHPTFKKSVQ